MGKEWPPLYSWKLKCRQVYAWSFGTSPSAMWPASPAPCPLHAGQRAAAPSLHRQGLTGCPQHWITRPPLAWKESRLKLHFKTLGDNGHKHSETSKPTYECRGDSRCFAWWVGAIPLQLIRRLIRRYCPCAAAAKLWSKLREVTPSIDRLNYSWE